jgi:hypothetical protein
MWLYSRARFTSTGVIARQEGGGFLVTGLPRHVTATPRARPTPPFELRLGRRPPPPVGDTIEKKTPPGGNHPNG